jgi:pilus assembly protein Flp/PilA
MQPPYLPLEDTPMFNTMLTLLRDDDGATMVEYAIMVALIAAVSIIIVGTLGQNVSKTFNSVNQSL